MRKEEFYEKVLEEIRDYLPEDLKEADIEISTVVKNNDEKLEGLVIQKGGELEVCPTIYLEKYYDMAERGEPMDNILRGIYTEYEEGMKAAPQIEIVMGDFDEVKEKIVFQITEIERNQERLKRAVYTPMGNGLAMTYALVLKIGAHDEGRATITRDMCSSKNWEIEDIHEAAISNTQRLYPAVLNDMLSIIDGKKENLLENKGEKMEPGSMYVLTNEKCIQGAAALFYPEIQKEVSEVLGGSFYAIPSSVHEFIILPDDGKFTPESLGDMVKDANETVVDPRDVLSGKVFRFDKERESLEVAFDDRIKEKEAR